MPLLNPYEMQMPHNRSQEADRFARSKFKDQAKKLQMFQGTITFMETINILGIHMVMQLSQFPIIEHENKNCPEIVLNHVHC